jgi:hypothetical protein
MRTESARAEANSQPALDIASDIDDFDEFHVSNCPDKITYKGIHFIVESEMVQFIEEINVKEI